MRVNQEKKLKYKRYKQHHQRKKTIQFLKVARKKNNLETSTAEDITHSNKYSPTTIDEHNTHYRTRYDDIITFQEGTELKTKKSAGEGKIVLQTKLSNIKDKIKLKCSKKKKIAE